MSFFDKFFSNRNRINSHENSFKAETGGLSFRSSHLTISKEQIRFLLFRECDKRGRKLLFDSSSVEKVLLPSGENMCSLKCQQQTEKFTDFIEITKTHGYKYKKPPSDVSSLGEMVFGSVAVVYKAENSCKIHSIPSPKRLMFTTIVHAPFHKSFGSSFSELNRNHSSGSSLASLTNILNQHLTSSSDSKLYRHKGIVQKYSSTYPWIKPNFPVNEVKQCCEISDVDYNSAAKSFLCNSSELKCSSKVTSSLVKLEESLYLDKRTDESEKFCSEGNFPMLSSNNLYLCQKNLEFDGSSLSNCDSSGITSNESENISSVSDSLSSLRRRWFHSHSTSLDSTAYEDNSNSPSKRRTKLGMALILDLSNTLEDEIEKLIFNHTILIESIMGKLQDSVELAYIKNENFVDLIYTSFLECQESIYELITGGKYETPIWCSVLGNSFDSDNLETQLTRMNLGKKNTGIYNKQDVVNNVKLKFLNDFCDVLVKFDTKDTNFFISTLLTAVLTHHLSWVTSIAETDLKSPNENLSVINSIRPYNPIWAQMNDLCGLLGSPLKSAKTVVTGPECKKNQLATIIEVLSYFIRCNNVVENIYDVNIEDIISSSDLESSNSSSDSVREVNVCGNSADACTEKQCFNSEICRTQTVKPTIEVKECGQKLEKELLLQHSNIISSGSERGLKRNKSYLSNTEMENAVRHNDLYPDIKDLAARENINVDDLNYVENERTVVVENLLGEKLKEKIQKMIRVPSVNVKPYAEGHLSPDEGYVTIDSTKTDIFKENKVQMEKQRSASESRNENIVFLLGENEELVNLQKKIVVNKSSFVEMEKEDSREFLCTVGSNENKSKENSRALETSCDEIWMNHSGINVVEHSSNKSDGPAKVSVKKPWILREMKMPRTVRPCRTRQLEVSSVLGGVNQHFNSEQIIQGVLEPRNLLEQTLQKDLFLCAHYPVLEKSVSEALCIVADMNSWEVTVFSSNKSALECNKGSGVRVGMSQLVADMLESFLYLHACSLSPSFCLLHIEKKLQEIYLKSKTVAEFLNSTELCSMDYLTTSLDIGINDVPLLLSVATTHSPDLAEKYTLSYS